MPPVPLPAHAMVAETPAFQGNEGALAAYGRLLPLEQGNHIVLIRLLGWMLIHAPCPAGHSFVAEAVNACNNNEAIVALGKYYLTYFANCFIITKNKGSATPSTHPSQGAVDAFRNNIMAGLRAPPQDHRDAKEQALVRDNYCCIVTGAVDMVSHESSTDVQETVPDVYAPGLKRTQCSHILPSHINRHLNTADKIDHSATVWAVLGHFGGINLGELNGPGVHCLSNILTLEVGLHFAFDGLDVWLEPIEGMQNGYTIGRQRPLVWQELPAQVFLTTMTDIPLPNRQYLALHAACTKVVNMSGAAEVIDHIVDDYEDIKVLASDGSSAELLEYLLFGTEIMAH